MSPLLALAAQAAAARSELRWKLAGLAVGWSLLSIGLASQAVVFRQ